MSDAIETLVDAAWTDFDRCMHNLKQYWLNTHNYILNDAPLVDKSNDYPHFKTDFNGILKEFSSDKVVIAYQAVWGETNSNATSTATLDRIAGLRLMLSFIGGVRRDIQRRLMTREQLITKEEAYKPIDQLQSIYNGIADMVNPQTKKKFPDV